MTPTQQAREALEAILDRYTGLVNCGDCGNWNPEIEPEVIAARAALAALAEPAPVIQHPAAIYLDDGTMTVVYRNLSRDEARALMEHPKFSAASWSHALNDRDRLHAALPFPPTKEQQA